ncbi:MAG: amidase domain-containing protein [Clostridia bacterium]|nr:amidase domain-containing protein [Clostridia bacterium]
MRLKNYDRNAAVSYARAWAFGRNPNYYNFDGLGGDCTNFVSQCIFAGAGVMNYSPVFGWYYISSDSRAPSWTGVEFLGDFLLNNAGAGPFGRLGDGSDCDIGDVVQFARGGDFYHSAIISGISGGEILLAAHTFDALNRPLRTYSYEQARFIRIGGVRI